MRTKSIVLDDRNILQRYGLIYNDFESEDEKESIIKTDLQQIHDEVIHEVDEGGQEASVLNSIEKIKESHILAGGNQLEENRKVAIRGMCEIKPILQKKINKKCTDLDEFTEEILGPEKREIATRNPTPTNENIPNINHPHINFAEFDNLIYSKELSPKNKMLDDDMGIMVPGMPFSTMASFQPKFNDSKHKEEKVILENIIKKSSTIVKDDSACNFASLHSTILSNNTKVKESNKSSLMRSHTVIGRNQENIKKENLRSNFVKNEIPLLRKLTPKFKEDEKPSDLDTPKAYFEEKFILKTGSIATESAEDVRPLKFKKVINMKCCVEITKSRPPYKVKIKYLPTEWPIDLFKNVEDKEKNESKEIEKDFSAQSSIMSGTSKSEIRTPRRRKSTKINRNNKKKKPDAENKIKSPRGRDSENPSEKPITTISQALSESAISGSKTKKIKQGEEENKIEKQKMSILEEHKKIKDEISIGVKPEVQWSGQEVILNSDPNSAVWLTKNLNSLRIWHHGIKGNIGHFRHIIKKIMGSAITDTIMNFIIIINTIALALVRYNQPESEAYALDQLNLAFTVIFSIELVLKLFAFGITQYLADVMNCIDGIVVIFSWV